jgi:hypothetical protein
MKNQVSDLEQEIAVFRDYGTAGRGFFNLKTAVDLGGRPQALESIEVATAAHFTNLVTTAVAVTACRHKTWAESESSTALFRFKRVNRED